MATKRSSRGSRARYTSPIPPAPRAETISYGPRRVPGMRAKRGQLYGRDANVRRLNVYQDNDETATPDPAHTCAHATDDSRRSAHDGDARGERRLSAAAIC